MSLSVGTALRFARRSIGLSQERMARRLHVSPQALSRYETGSRRCPPDVIARAVAVSGCKDLARAYCAACPLCCVAEGARPWLS